jgi:hypothetical protein
MNISAYRSRFKRIVIAVLLLTFTSWSHEGLVICYGADGHIEIERPSEKDCCKKAVKSSPATLLEQSELDHCVDVPIGAAKYIASTSYTASFQNYDIPLSVVSPLVFSINQPGQAVHNDAISPPHNPLLSSLKTVVLLI